MKHRRSLLLLAIVLIFALSTIVTYADTTYFTNGGKYYKNVNGTITEISRTAYENAVGSDESINEDPSNLLNDPSTIRAASDAVGETKKDIEIMGMSVYILIRAASTVIGLIVGLILFVQYMAAGKNANKRADVIGGIGHFLAGLGGIFAIGWIIGLVYKFAVGLTGGV